VESDDDEVLRTVELLDAAAVLDEISVDDRVVSVEEVTVSTVEEEVDCVPVATSGVTIADVTASLDESEFPQIPKADWHPVPQWSVVEPQ